MTAVLSNRISAYETIRSSLQTFIGTSNLKGHAYQSAKDYSSQVLIPLLKGCILLDEAIKEACAKLPSEYRSRVDVISLKESDLNDKIDRAQSMIDSYQRLIDWEYCRDEPDYGYISNLRDLRNSYQELHVELTLKRDKLVAYNGSSPSLFSDIHSLLEAVQQGLRQASLSWHSGTRTFKLSSEVGMAWVDSIENNWERSQHGIADLILKAEQGLGLTNEEFQTLGNYLNSHPDFEIYDRGIKVVAETSEELDISKISNWAGWTFTGNLAFKEAIASYRKFKKGTFWRSAVKSTKTGFKTWKQVMGDVNRFKIVKQAKKLDEIVNGTGTIIKGTGVKGIAKSLGIIGTVSIALDGFSAYSESKGRGESTLGAIVDATVHTGVSVTGAYVGAVIGSAIPIPVVGTLVGVWVGSMVGEAISTAYDAATNGKKVDSNTGWDIVDPFD